MANSKASLAVVCSKLDTHSAMLKEHLAESNKIHTEIREALYGCDEYPGVRGRLQRLEDVESNRKWHIRSLWLALLAGIMGFLGVR